MSELFQHWTVCLVLRFHVLILSILFTIKPTNFKKSYYQISKKTDQISINLITVYDFIGLLSNYLCPFTKYAKIYNKATIYVNKLILTLFSPLNNKCRKLIFLKQLGKFFIVSGSRICIPWFLLEFSRIMLKYSA